MIFRTGLWKISCFCALALLAGGAARGAGERRTSFNDGWRFFKGEAAGAESPGFNDAAWRRVQLPHDWAIEGPFDEKYNARCGGLPFYGVAWYRKRFTLPAQAKGRYYGIDFDGAMSNARVFLNGKELGARPYGYIGFSFDMTPLLRFGQENVLAVRLAPEDLSSRWYPGAGIYRNVWLVATGAVHVARWGTYITTPNVTAEKAEVAVKTELRNRGSRAARITLETTVVDANGKQVARTASPQNLPAGGTQSAEQKLDVANPHRWDVDSPYLYQLVTVLKDGSRVLDRYVTPFGIRTIEFDAKRGFLLNGRYLKIKGVCMHHDLGALGAAVSRRATERQLQIMKAMGANAIRTSHNPPSPEQMEYCDRLGLLVMDEAFDMWRLPKVPNGYSKYFDQWSETDLRDMIRRDRNHPSIIIWSIGNEILEQSKTDGWKIARRLADICHEEDRSRPVTAGMNNLTSAIRNNFAAQVDLKGFNYKASQYRQVLQEHPDWIVFGSETASCTSSRGVYHLPLKVYQKDKSLQVTSYDIIAPPWAYPPDIEFQAQEDLPNVLGEFVWTGFDYLGEPTPYGGRDNHTNGQWNSDWPSRSSYFGIVDLCGFPKDRYYLYQSEWTAKPMVHVLPHWNWAGREGQAIPVMCYTNCDEVELFLNGRSLGRKKRWSDPMKLTVSANVSPDKEFTSKYRLVWQVPYEAGSLQAVAYKNGARTVVDEVRTAGAPARIVLQPDRTHIAADGEDLSFVTVRVEDKDGNLCPLADNLVHFKVEGAGRIAAVDNGNAATVEPFQANYRKAFNGLAMLIVRSERGKAGAVRIAATSDGLRGAETVIRTEGPANRLAPQEKAAGWRLLFDGMTMAGWEDPRQKTPAGDAWTIEDGCLKSVAHPRITEDLFTTEKYRDFELEFDWRIAPGGNSGVKYRIQDRVFLADKHFKKFEDLVNYSLKNRGGNRPAKGQEYVIGFEYQVIDNARHRDAKRGAKYQSGAIYDMVGATRDATKSVGEFNHSRLLVKGNHVEHWLNGVKVVDADLAEAAKGEDHRWGEHSPVAELLERQPRRDCPISLQNHNNEAWFRNIKIRRLD